MKSDRDDNLAKLCDELDRTYRRVGIAAVALCALLTLAIIFSE